jgi:two-component system, LytTR family, response regulator
MHKIRALLIDDEEGALNTLRGMLSEFCPEVQIIGTSKNVTDSIHKIETLFPDLVFLDIEMPPLGNGFDIIRLSRNQSFEVVSIWTKLIDIIF